ncbi:MAG TPA: hypothetical protein VFT64_04640 [Rickettsiales bacterium]|nr:hypothetical protein [Rickettsiales bacterium]
MASYTTGRYLADAYVINTIGQPNAQGTPLLLDNGTTVTASRLLISRFSPRPGDYWVIQEDGRISIIAKSVFEKNYKPSH